METPEKMFRAAVPSELMSAIDETPALIIPVVVCFAALEAVPLDGTPLAAVNSASLHLFRACLGALIGVVFYSWGNFWDDKVFDPRYGLRGNWISSPPKWGLPSASDLAKYRKKAASILPGVSWFVVNSREEYLGPKSLANRWVNSNDALTFKTEAEAEQEAKAVGGNVEAQGVYLSAEEFVRAAGRWHDVQGPLVISKFVRSFIWPVFIAGTVMGLLAVLDLFRPDYRQAAANGAAAAVCTAIALLSFFPYFHFRVKHMSGLYRLVVRVAPRQ